MYKYNREVESAHITHVIQPRCCERAFAMEPAAELCTYTTHSNLLFELIGYTICRLIPVTHSLIHSFSSYTCEKTHNWQL